MLRVVADTNIFISALLFGGLPGSFLDIALANSFLLVTSPALLDELDEKLRRKFRVSSQDAQTIRTRLETSALVVEPDLVLAVIHEDPDNDRVLECAVAGKADYVVSGDRHLLKLSEYQGIAIVNVRRFMDAIEVAI